MRTKKKLLFLVSLVVLALLLGFLWNPQGRGQSWRPGRPLDREQVKVAVLYLADPSAGGYSRAHDAGILEMQRTLELRDDQIIRKLSISDLNKPAVELAMR